MSIKNINPSLPGQLPVHRFRPSEIYHMYQQSLTILSGGSIV